MAAAIPAELLLRPGPFGVNLALASACVAAALLWVTDRTDDRYRVRALLGALLVALASVVALRDASLLWLAVMVAMVATLALVTLPDARVLWRAEPLGVALRAFVALLQSASGPVRLFAGDVDWGRDTPPTGRWRHARGLAWSIPVVLPFVVLFAEADPVFSRLVHDLVDMENLISHVALWAFLAWLIVGWVTAAHLPWRPSAAVQAPLGTRETVWVLAALALVFDVFVALQLRWFFGGEALLQEATGLTYAEYARRGFFELVAVGALLLAVLLVADWVTRDAERSDRRQVRLLSIVLLAFLAVVLASALLRMRLYIGEFGLTQLRFFTTAFMIWLVAVFGWFGATVLRERRHLFPAGVYFSGVAAVLLLAVIDPIARIAAYNVEQAERSDRFDVAYAVGLGGDAVPVLVDAFDQVDAEHRCALAQGLAGWAEGGDGPVRADWRTWNRSAARAQRLVEENLESFRAECGDLAPPRSARR